MRETINMLSPLSLDMCNASVTSAITGRQVVRKMKIWEILFSEKSVCRKLLRVQQCNSVHTRFMLRT